MTEQKQTDVLTNQYVREYYDSHLGKLGMEYEHDRWHKTPEREFEYQQTAHALERALGQQRFRTALEVGPGDGVWTPRLATRVDRVHLIEQSGEMLQRARTRLATYTNITYEQGDVERITPQSFDLVVAVRCFEYFADKKMALQQIHSTLKPCGSLIIISKNPRLLGARRVHHKRLHTGQVSAEKMQVMLQDAGFCVEHVYPAVFRLKTRYTLSRLVFGALHRLAVWARSVWFVPFAEKATESYVYVAKKQRN